MARTRLSAGTRLRWLGSYIAQSWRDTDASLRTGALVMWATAVVFTVVGVWLDNIGWWDDKPFSTNLLTTVTGGLYGVPIVVVILQRLSKEQYSSYIDQQQQRFEERRARDLAIQRRIMEAAGRARERRGEEPVRNELEAFLQSLDAQLPPRTSRVQNLLTDLETASTPVPPHGSVSAEAAAAMRSALREWPSIPVPSSLAVAQADWQGLRALMPDTMARRASLQIVDFSAKVGAVREPDTTWYEEALRRVGTTGNRIPRRSTVSLFATGRDTLRALLGLGHALDALRAALGR